MTGTQIDIHVLLPISYNATPYSWFVAFVLCRCLKCWWCCCCFVCAGVGGGVGVGVGVGGGVGGGVGVVVGGGGVGCNLLTEYLKRMCVQSRQQNGGTGDLSK